MFRVTFVTADDALADSVVEPLRAAGFEVLRLTGFEEGVEPDPAAAPDVLTLDLRNAGKPSRSPLQDAWATSFALALVTPAQVASLDPACGIDDFIVTPLHVPEFVARVEQALWRHGRSTRRNTIAAGELLMDMTNYQVFESGRAITLTYKEFELLRFLMTHAGSVFGREQLLNRVWGYHYYGGSRTVDVHIRRLRSKLAGSRYDYIETLRNVGYRFSEPLR